MLFIRNGETEANTNKTCGGQYNLTEKGKQQAANILVRPAVMVVTSKLPQAQETAKIVYPDAEIVIDGTFNEIYFGELENKNIQPDDELYKIFKETPWLLHEYVKGCDNIEKRARKALTRAKKYPPGTICFSHGMLMQAMKSVYMYGTVEYMRTPTHVGHIRPGTPWIP